MPFFPPFLPFIFLPRHPLLRRLPLLSFLLSIYPRLSFHPLHQVPLRLPAQLPRLFRRPLAQSRIRIRVLWPRLPLQSPLIPPHHPPIPSRCHPSLPHPLPSSVEPYCWPEPPPRPYLLSSAGGEQRSQASLRTIPLHQTQLLSGS